MIDKLDHIFQIQTEMQGRYQTFPFKDHKDKQQYINLNILACLDELSECLRETQWKNPAYIEHGWKNTQTYNEQQFKEEITDLLHFFINLCLASGMDAKELYREYLKKNKINLGRLDNGY